MTDVMSTYSVGLKPMPPSVVQVIDLSLPEATGRLLLSGQMRETLLKVGIKHKLGDVAVVGVIIVWTVGEDDVRVGLANQIDHDAALCFVGEHEFVGDGRPQQARPKNRRRGFRFLFADTSQLGRAEPSGHPCCPR